MNATSRFIESWRAALIEDRKRRGSAFRTDQAAFLPAALEVIETPVSPTARATAWLLMIGLLVAIIWLTFGRLDVVASASGKLVPAGNVKLIQAAQTGVVRAILVQDGQRVRAGQPLIQFDPTISTADVDQAKKAVETSMLDAARERAVLRSLDQRKFAFEARPGTAADVAAVQAALARAEFANIEASVASAIARRDSAAAARSEAQVQVLKLSETLPLLDEQIAANEQLLSKGYVAKLKVIEMRRQRLSAARDRDASMATANRASADMIAAQNAISQSIAEARAKLLAGVAQAESDARLRGAELAKATQRSSLQTLVSPVNGTITSLAVHTLSGVVEAAKPIMIVVPDGDTLIAEVNVLNRDSGFVHVGDEVAVKLEAFPFTRYGTLRGKVQNIASDAIQDKKLGLVYPARILLDLRNRKNDSAIVVTAGMQITADIKTGRRSILSYLLSPIDKLSHDAARER